MKAQRQLFTVLAAAILAAPVGAATWYGYGTYEPDTTYDRSGGYMQTDPDVTSTGKNLYFNVYQTEYPTGQNANVGTLGSRITVAGVQQYRAMLGAWKDCNGDDYVGFAESALVTYPSTLLNAFDATICPPGSFHNDGQWVYEYVPVGYQQETTPNLHPRQLVDTESRVWGDFNLPGAGAAGTCPIVPFPHGTTAGTGWAIRYADCFTSKNLVRTVNSIDSDGSLGLRFDDENNPQYSDSLLNQHAPESLFGNPATGETGFLQLDSDEDDPEYDGTSAPERREAAFTAWDCSGRTGVSDPTGLAPKTVSVDDPTPGRVVAGPYGKIDENLSDENGHYAWVANPAPAVHDPTDSYADGVNSTFRGFRIGGGDENRDTTIGGDCDTVGDDTDGDNTYSGTHQTVFFYADGNHEGNTQVAAKNKADVRFTYFNGAQTDPRLAEAFGPNTPNSVASTPSATALRDPGWSANVVYVTTPQSINRATLKPSGPGYVTFYAKVGSATLTEGWKPAGTTGKYGSEACGLNTSGSHGGWECDPANWYRDSNGNDISQPLWDVRVGSDFQFRDIDCNDGTLVRGVGVQASLVQLSPGYGDDPTHLTCRDG